MEIESVTDKWHFTKSLGSAQNRCRESSGSLAPFHHFLHAMKRRFYFKLRKTAVKDSLIFPTFCFWSLMSRACVSTGENSTQVMTVFARRHPTSLIRRKWKRCKRGNLAERFGRRLWDEPVSLSQTSQINAMDPLDHLDWLYFCDLVTAPFKQPCN